MYEFTNHHDVMMLRTEVCLILSGLIPDSSSSSQIPSKPRADLCGFRLGRAYNRRPIDANQADMCRPPSTTYEFETRHTNSRTRKFVIYEYVFRFECLCFWKRDSCNMCCPKKGDLPFTFNRKCILNLYLNQLRLQRKSNDIHNLPLSRRTVSMSPSCQL